MSRASKGFIGMNWHELDEAADRKAESGILKLLGRGAMVASIPASLAAMTWLGSTLWTMNTNMAVLTGEVRSLREQMWTVADGRYRSSDAEKDFRLRDQIIAVIRDTIERMDRRLERMEAKQSPPHQ